MASDAPPSGGQAGRIFGPLVDVAIPLAKIVGPATGLSGLPAVVDLIAALINIQVGQAAALRSIKADTAILRNSPMREGLKLLEDARRVGPDDGHWRTYITRAEERLSTARTLVRGPAEETLVEFNIAVAFLALEHRKETRHHLELSRLCAEQAIDVYIRRAKPGYIRDISRCRERPAEQAPSWREWREVFTGTGRNVYAMFDMPDDDPWRSGFKHLPVETVIGYAISPIAAPFFTVYNVPRGFSNRRAIQELKGFIDLYNLVQLGASQDTDRQAGYLTLEPYDAHPGEKVNKGVYQFKDLWIGD
ncbi:hypothetical protein ACLMAL_33075 [Nocardia sp. CWNU-33]|uniref:hypothetical protein n=1 Tax=Nocardia sp. CWNU-33 TaxID=3392117 RepID=UPI00398F4412